MKGISKSHLEMIMENCPITIPTLHTYMYSNYGVEIKKTCTIRLAKTGSTVALTGGARGAQTFPLASSFLVRSSIALRLLSGEHWCFGCSGLVEDICLVAPSDSPQTLNPSTLSLYFSSPVLTILLNFYIITATC